MGKIRKEDVWLWGHPAGSFTGRNWGEGLDGSAINPGDAAKYMGIDNVIMVRSGGNPVAKDFEKHMQCMKNLKKVKWSAIGDGGSEDTPFQDLEVILKMADKYKNIDGVMFDDFFRSNKPDSKNRITAEDTRRIKEKLAPRKMDLWAVYYEQQLDVDISGDIQDIDTINFWTWYQEHIEGLEANLAKVQRVAKGKKIALGLYMWDFGNKKPISLEAMEKQCEIALKNYEAGVISAIVFLASCICDLKIEAVEWSRGWVAENTI